MKTLNKLALEGNYLNLIKGIYHKPAANIFNGEILMAFPVRSGTEQGCLFLPLLFIIVMEVLGRLIEQEKEIKRTQIGKEEVKLPPFADGIIFYIKKS